MNRKIIKFFSLILLAIVLPLLFVGCDGKKEDLLTPTLSIQEINKEIYAVATKIENADGYYFEVNNRYFYSNTEKLNISNIALEYKQYNIRVYAVGNKEFNNSGLSNECIYINQQKYDTPVLNIINNSYLTWTNIGDVTYQIRINNSTQLIETKQTEISLLDDVIFEKLNLTKENTFSVKVKKSSNILSSEYSNEVKFAFISAMQTPSDVIIQQNEGKSILYWQGNADSYEVYINNSKVTLTQSLSFDVSNFITQPSEYSFNIRAISDSSLIAPSNLSETITITRYAKHSTPSLDAVFDGENIIVSWNNDESVKSYTLKINNVSTEVFSNSYVLNKELLLSNNIEEYSFSVFANAYGYYYASEESEIKQVGNMFTTLNSPSNLSIGYLDEQPYICFIPLLNVDSYILKIDEEEFEVNSTYINLLNYVVEPKEYNISVKSKGKDFYLDSEFSQEITYVHTLKLNKVEGVEYSIMDSKLLLSWQEVENADAYGIKIVYDKFTYIKNDIENTSFIYNLTKSGKYYISIQAFSSDENYSLGDFSDEVTANYTILLSSPTNFKYTKDDSYLVLSWFESKYAKSYLLKNSNLDLVIDTTEREYKILLSKFNPEEEYIFLLSSLGNDENIIDSPFISLSYTHNESENKGEIYIVESKEKDFYIETFDELVDLIKYAYEFKKTSVSAFMNFNYSNDLDDNTFYSEYVSVIAGYTKEDNTIKNEIISAIIKNNLVDKMTFVGTTKVLTQFKLIFEYLDFEVNKSFVGDLNYQINTSFVGYKSGNRNSVNCEMWKETPISNSVNTTEQFLKVIKMGYKPIFEQSNNGNVVAQYYERAIEILKEINAENATPYQIALSVFDYLCSHTTYDFSLQEELKNQNNLDYMLYYSNNIDGVLKNNKATSVGLAKTYVLMLNMMGINAEEIIIKVDGYMVGYAEITINNKKYIVDFYSSIFTSNEIDDRYMQYYSHFYFCDNTSNLTYIANANAYEIENYFANYKQNTNTIELNLNIETANKIVDYCLDNEISAMELQCTATLNMLEMMFSLIETESEFEHKEFYSTFGTLFIQIAKK